MGPFISANDGVQIEWPTLADKPGGTLMAESIRSAMDVLWNETREPRGLARIVAEELARGDGE